MNIIKSYKELRFSIGIIGMVLPFLLILWIILSGQDIPKSISCTYYTNGRDLLVGSLSAVALFMFFYNGYNKFENWLGNLAAIFSLGVAFIPCDSELRILHLISAALLFTVFAIFCLQFAKGGNRLFYYSSFSVIILSMIALVFIGNEYKHSIYILETIMLETFGLSWLIKSKKLIK